MTNICIAIPSGDMIHTDVALSLVHITHHLRTQGIEASILNMRSARISDLRNKMTAKILDDPRQFTHIMWLDSDVLIPAQLIPRLLNFNADIIGCTYIKRTPPHDFCHVELDNGGTTPLRKVHGLPGGCMLVRTRVYREIEKNMDAYQSWYKEEELGEDLQFCERARAHGYELWLDSEGSAPVKHIGTYHYGIDFTQARPV